MRPHIIQAMILRSFRGTFIDKGRVSELVVFPLSFLVIWGFFFASDLIERKLAGQLLVVNLIWSVSGTFQAQANLTMVFDLWSKEFANILRQGVRIGEIVVAHLFFSTLLGLINLLLFLLCITSVFGGGENESRLFIELFPLYYISSVGLAAIFGGFILILGRSYAFIAWTGLQLLIMISSPFSPLSSLPDFLRYLAYLSPFTYVFEFVRFERIEDYWMGLVASVTYLILGCISAVMFYRLRRARQGLMEV